MDNRSHPLKPRPNAKFLKRDVEKKVEAILQERVGDKAYNYNDTMAQSKELCSEIQQAVLNMGYERYKLVVQVTIAEACSQGLRIASRCLWDPEVDNFAQFTFSTEHMHVTGIVFGLYWE